MCVIHRAGRFSSENITNFNCLLPLTACCLLTTCCLLTACCLYTACCLFTACCLLPTCTLPPPACLPACQVGRRPKPGALLVRREHA